MDPNNNQPINANPLGQPAQQPVAMPVQPLQQPAQTQTSTTTPVAPQPVVTSEPISQPPKRAGKKGIALLLILIILILGMGFYVFFVKNQINSAKKASTENTSVIIPTIVPTAAPVTLDEIDVSSPDADLKGIEADLQGL